MFSRARRPKGAARIDTAEKDGLNGADAEGFGGYRDSPYSAKSAAVEDVNASPQLAAIMQEQQAIISQLRVLCRAGCGGGAP